MIIRRLKITVQGLKMAMLAAGMLPAAVGTVVALEQSPLLDSRELPPLAMRLPSPPAVADAEPGEYGGELRLLMGKSKDIRMMMVYGYARLVAYTPQLQLKADIVESFHVENERIFTFHLRRNHRWSDGHPFTAEAFRYYWEDVANNADLSPFGPPRELLVNGRPPRVEFPDDFTVVYRFAAPNPAFLPALAGPRPLFIYKPGHYLRRFHVDYAEGEALQTMIKEAGARNWQGLHHRRDRPYRFSNPDLPTLQPWRNTTPPPSERFVFERNPFYHRVDRDGRQLPYIDRVVINIASNRLIPAKTGAGESDLQGRYLSLGNYTALRESEERNNYSVRLWRNILGAQVALFPNLNSSDPVWRELVRDRRFRRALSLAVNRYEINKVVYFGMVIEGNNTLLPLSPLHRDHYRRNWAEFDLGHANRLLDEMGLSGRDKRGIRLRPDGKPLEIVLQTAGESTEETDVLELVHDSWLRAGVKLYTRPSTREVFRNRVFSGQAMMSVWSGVSNGIATAGMSPAEFAPTSQQQLQWPKWGEFHETAGQRGQPPELEPARRLARLNRQWRDTVDGAERRKIWEEMLDIHSSEIFTIGIVCGVPQPVVVSNRLRNVPQDGVYAWSPTSYFGVYRPDTFWFSGPR